MRHLLKVLLLIMMIATFFSGCERKEKKDNAEDGGIISSLESDLSSTDEEETIEIVLAVKSHRKDLYQAIANVYNKKDPHRQVVVKSDYYKSRLLEEFDAGKGPVLVDTLLCGYAEQKQRWEPLDDLLAREEFKGVFFENILATCKIDGVTYGIPMDFSIDTVITQDPISPAEWTYDYFIKAAKEREYLALFEPPYGGDARWKLIFIFFMSTLEDSYFINMQDSENPVDLEKLNEVLDLAEKYGAGGSQMDDWREHFRNGELLCQDSVIQGGDAMFYRKKDYGKDIRYVGYPTRDGGKSYAAVMPLVIRASASEEEKEIAREFMLEAISYEGQMAAYKGWMNFGLSIRRDVLENQSRVQFQFADQLKELIESACGKQSASDELYDTMYDSIDDLFERYFNEELSRDALFEELKALLQSHYLEGR